MGRSITDVSAELQHALETALAKAHRAELADSKAQPPEWHLSLAQGYMAQRDWKLAAEHFDSYTRLRPDDHEAQFSKGVSYANVRGGDESNHAALRAYNEAIAFLPANADMNWIARCYAYRAAVMRRLGRYDEAENDLALAVRYSAEDYERSDVIYNLATVYALQGRRSEMLGMVKQLLSRRHLQGIRSHLNDNFSAYATDTEFLDLCQGTLQSLIVALDRFDVAILVLTPDDVVSSRDVVSQAPRDNVLFELGLFMGRLGPTRTFVVSRDESMQLPSDLAGVTLAHYESRRMATEPRAAVEPACFDIRQSLRSLGFTPARGGQRLESAATAVENISERVTRLIHLLARSRILELEVITKQFGPVLPHDFAAKILKDLRDLEDASNDNTRNA